MDIWTESTRRRRGRVGRWFGKAGAYARTMFNVNDVLIFFLSFQLAYGVCASSKIDFDSMLQLQENPLFFHLVHLRVVDEEMRTSCALPTG